MRARFSVLIAAASALPDAITAGVFLFAWLYPTWHPELPAMLMLVMLIEFLAVHSGGMLGAFALDRSKPAKTRLKAILGLSFFYGLFVFGFAMAFESLWPVWWLLWLIFTKVSLAIGPVAQGKTATLMTTMWGISAAFYLLMVMVTTILPIPRLGIDYAAVRMMELPGEGLWVDEPWRVIAFGFLYFFALAVARYGLRRRLGSESTTRGAKMQGPPTQG
ncbi:MAG: hypothetical protein R3200_12455 [Xanthomonadales bacterium]|nr:hypothetical protein [Xanthomonadales bacterium]